MSKKISVLIIALILVAAVSFGAVKTYQVTGPVLEVTPTMIAVQKGADRWEIARDANTKITGELKVGSKVTIEYRMTATSVTVKEASPKKK
jgi:heme/copper-type cytochrome/quinol oxidase subunit 2